MRRSVTAAQLREILGAYALGAARTEPLPSADNHVFRVDTAAGRRFMLRVHHGFDPIARVAAHVGTEFGWLEHIRSTTDLEVPRPVRLPGGDPCGMVNVEGRARVFVLFDWIEGEPFSVAPPLLRQMGRAIARLHCTSRDLAPPPDFCDLRWDETTFFGADSWIAGGQAEIDLRSRRFELVRDASKRVQVVMQQLGRDSRYYGLIHSDAHPGNMLLSQGDIALVDFNDCGWGHYAFDLGVMLNELPGAHPHAELREAVLRGYEEVAPLPVTDREQIEAFVALRSLASLQWIARSPDPEERRAALRSRPGVPIIMRQLESFVAGAETTA